MPKDVKPDVSDARLCASLLHWSDLVRRSERAPMTIQKHEVI
jgi:hypothetical protein